MNSAQATLELLPKWFYILYISLFGLCAGSFLNVVVLRGLKNESFLKGRSKCPKCHNQLAWYMNIPLVSYIFLGGKCAFCKEKISIQYPIVEFFCAFLFVLSYLKLGFNIDFFFSLAFIFLSLALFIEDIKERVIIDYHTYSLAVFGLIYSFFPSSNLSFLESVLGAIFGFLGLEVFSRLSEKIFSQRAFGEGDSLIVLAYGAILGLKPLILLIPLAILIQAVLALPILSIDCFKNKKTNLGVSYVFVFLSLIFLCLNKFLNLIKDENIYLIFVLLITALLVFALINILKDIKEKKEKFSELDIKDVYQKENPYKLFPFGPALVLSFLLCFYFKEEIIKIFKLFI